MLGQSPDAMTLRELMIRAESRLKYSMDGPALVAAAIVNQYRRHPIAPAQLNPYRKSNRKGVAITRGNLRALAAAVVGRDRPDK